MPSDTLAAAATHTARLQPQPRTRHACSRSHAHDTLATVRYSVPQVSTQTDAKSLAGAIASCTREGSRVELTAIGAGSVNQAPYPL